MCVCLEINYRTKGAGWPERREAGGVRVRINHVRVRINSAWGCWNEPAQEMAFLMTSTGALSPVQISKLRAP